MTADQHMQQDKHLEYAEEKPIAPGVVLSDVAVCENGFLAIVVRRDQFRRKESAGEVRLCFSGEPIVQVDQTMHPQVQVTHLSHVRMLFLVMSSSRGPEKTLMHIRRQGSLAI